MTLEQMRKALTQVLLEEQAQEVFLRLFKKFQEGPAKVNHWDLLRSPGEDQLLSYDALKVPDNSAIRGSLSRISVCKLNGGLGTSMGCQGPKSSIEVRKEKSFLDLIVDQLRGLENEYQVKVPLILMNSFYTHDATEKIVQKYHGLLEVISFQQNRFPRIREDSLEPLGEEEFGLNAWYPPGHGDFYTCLWQNGILARLLKEGREVLFVSNADNLGAVVDPKIASHILDNDIPFLIEMTPKTPADVKGGTIYQDKDRLKLLEIACVPEEHIAEFCSQEKFKVFNTNNIWINLRHLKKKMQEGPLGLDVIVNRKTTDGVNVIQLETAIGSALECFPGAVGLNVSRDRFLPVKKTDDLLSVQSDLFVLNNGHLTRNPERKLPGLPVIRLGGAFALLEDYHDRIPDVPGLLDLKSLEVEGDVRFGKAIRLKGNIKLTALREPLVIPDGSTLSDQTMEQ